MRLFKKEISDAYTKENFVALEDFINSNPLLKGQFKFYEMPLSAPSYPTDVSFKHNLNFIPKDILVTSKIGSGNYTFLFDQTDRGYIYVNITGPVVLRAFLGTYSEGR